MTAMARRLSLRGRRPSLGMASGVSAIIVKELRSRMRGRRAFVILTLYVLLLAAFAWSSQQIHQAAVSSISSYPGQANYASAAIGRGIFGDLLMLQTLMIAVLAPAATAGAISSEREHQTLELLAVTPISSIAIVVGKLLSALAWVFVLVLASVPVTALVFVFGGVAADDVLRGYLVLVATVIGLGSIGLFFSAMTRRTGAATGLTFVVTIALVLGSQYLFDFMSQTAKVGANGLRETPPAAILYMNPFVAQADVSCGTEDGYSGRCSVITSVLGFYDQGFGKPGTDRPGTLPVEPQPCCGVGGSGIGLDDGTSRPPTLKGGGVLIDPNGGVTNGDVVVDTLTFRDRFWPKTVISFLSLAAVLTLASIQFVSPTRRWRPSLPGPVRRLNRRRSAP